MPQRPHQPAGTDRRVEVPHARFTEPEQLDGHDHDQHGQGANAEGLRQVQQHHQARAGFPSQGAEARQELGDGLVLLP